MRMIHKQRFISARPDFYNRNIIFAIVGLVLISCAILIPLLLVTDDGTESQETNVTSIATPTATSAEPPATGYDQYEDPLRAESQMFVAEDSLDGCPVGTGVNVLFGHGDCQSICSSLKSCIGYNFDSTQNLCTFFTNILCMDFAVDSSETVQGYLKNRIF